MSLSHVSQIFLMEMDIMVKHLGTIHQDRASEDRIRRKIRHAVPQKGSVDAAPQVPGWHQFLPQRMGLESKTLRAHWMLATTIIHHSNLHWSLEHRSGAQSNKIHQNLKTTRIAETRVKHGFLQLSKNFEGLGGARYT